ncbi:hypothetical protein Q7P35_009437 [Cladosporium inversicolor]
MRTKLLSAVFCIVQGSLALITPNGTRCSNLASRIGFNTYHAKHLNSTYHAATTVHVPSGASNISNNIPFCEVYASVNYAKGANLVFALWLPDQSDYEQRFLAVGDGAFGGVIDSTKMMDQLNLGLGFAVADPLSPKGTDDESAHTQRYQHFTPLAKSLTAKYYDKKPRYSYYNGCSVGGAQGLALARYHPDLFDGIHSSAPGADYDNLILSFLWNYRVEENVLPQEALDLVTNAVLDHCDSQDGVKYRLLTNPLGCPFRVKSLVCNGTAPPSNSSTTCLTGTQLDAFKAVYAGPTTSDTHEQVYPGYNLGSEVEWSYPIINGLSNLYTAPMLQNIVYRDTKWDPTTFNFTKAEVSYVEKRAGPLIDVTDPDLSAFKAPRGKLMATHGWADRLLTPLWTLGYRDRLEKKNGNLDYLFRLFMVPGGGHCDVAPGYPQAPANSHVMAPLIDWVERDVQPKSVLASDPPDGSGRTRKLCPWPQTARYESGNTDDWQSFVCV